MSIKSEYQEIKFKIEAVEKRIESRKNEKEKLSLRLKNRTPERHPVSIRDVIILSMLPVIVFFVPSALIYSVYKIIAGTDSALDDNVSTFVSGMTVIFILMISLLTAVSLIFTPSPSSSTEQSAPAEPDELKQELCRLQKEIDCLSEKREELYIKKMELDRQMKSLKESLPELTEDMLWQCEYCGSKVDYKYRTCPHCGASRNQKIMVDDWSLNATVKEWQEGSKTIDAQMPSN